MDNKGSLQQMKIDTIRGEREKHQLNLRKKSIQSSLIWKQLDNLVEYEGQFNIKPNHLKIDLGISQLRIRDEQSLTKAIELLNCESSIDNIKFGIFLFRKFFQEKIKEHPHELFYVDIFLSKGLLSSFEKVLSSNLMDDTLRFEILWTLINFTNYSISNSEYEYYPLLLSDSYIAIYSVIAQNSQKEIINLLFNLLFNICINNHKSSALILSHPTFILQTLNCLQEKDLTLRGIQSIFLFFKALTKDQSFLFLQNYIIKRIVVAIQKTIETVLDEGLVLVCLGVLSNLSETKVNEMFLSLRLTSTLLNLQMNQDDITFLVLKIINNTIIVSSNPLDVIASLLHIKLLDYYYNIAMVKKPKLLIQREILLSLANITYQNEEYVIEIVTHKIFSFIIESLKNPDIFCRNYATTALFYCLDFETVSLESIFMGDSTIIQTLLHNLSNETNKDILDHSLISLIRLISLELNISNEKGHSLRLYLLSNGIEDSFVKIEMNNDSSEYADKLKEILYMTIH